MWKALRGKGVDEDYLLQTINTLGVANVEQIWSLLRERLYLFGFIPMAEVPEPERLQEILDGMTRWGEIRFDDGYTLTKKGVKRIMEINKEQASRLGEGFTM